MKSLVKKQKSQVKASAKTERPAPAAEIKVAQCCAKVSKAVAGCHD
jgi:hypothetical protein